MKWTRPRKWLHFVTLTYFLIFFIWLFPRSFRIASSEQAKKEMICNFFPNFFVKDNKKLHLSSLFVCFVRSYLKSLLWAGKKKYLFTHLLYVEFWYWDKKYLCHFFIYSISWPTVSRIWTSLTLWFWVLS